MGMPKQHLASGEQVVLHFRSHAKVLFWPLVLLLVIFSVSVAGILLVPAGGAQGMARLGITVLALIVALWLVGGPLLKWWCTTYTVTNRRLVTRAGVFTRTGHDIPLYRINDVQLEKDLIDRIFGCGTLLVSDASEYGGVKLHDIPEVEQVQVQLNELLHAASAEARQEDIRRTR